MKSFKQFVTETNVKITSNFQNWFGDSKVVDEQGTPLVMYHGSRSPWIQSFDLGMEGTGLVNTGSKKYGVIWFTSVKQNAESYSEELEKKRADEDDVAVYGEKGRYYASISNIGEVPEDDDEDYIGGESIFTCGPYKDGDTAEREGIRQAKLYNKHLHHNTFIVDAYLRIENPLIVNVVPREKEFAAARAAGHDGIIAHDVFDGDRYSEIMVVFSPFQIKSASHNNGDFDPNDPDIRK